MRPVYAIAGLCLASLAVGLSALAFGWTSSALPDDPEEHLALLIETLGEHRPLEARLVGFDHWAPCETPEVGPIQPDTLLPEDVLPRTVCSPLPEAGTAQFEALWDLAPPSDAPESVALLRLQAVWDLVWRTEGDSDSAVQKLERAVELRDDDGTVWSDLSAAYLARAEDEDSPLDIIRAMDAAQRALDASPELAEALFNRALAFERFFQRESARRAWDDFLVVEPGSLYAHEARERLGPLSEPTLYEAWHGGGREELERAVLNGDQKRVDTLVERFAYFAREWVEEEVLPEWGEAELEGDQKAASRALVVSRAVGEEIAEHLGDWLIFESVQAVDASSGPTRQSIARGHSALGRAYPAYRSQDLNRAASAFADADQAFARTPSPSQAWVVFHQLVDLYFSDSVAAYFGFLDLADEIDASRYPALAGRIRWMLGLSTLVQGRYQAARSHLRSGIAILTPLESPDATSLLLYLAMAHGESGPTEAQSQAYQFRALVQLELIGDPRRLYNLYHAVISSLPSQETHLSHLLSSRLITEADRWGEIVPQADARLTRARLLQGKNRVHAAMELLAEARDLVERAPSSDLRERVRADLDLSFGETLRAAGRHDEAIASLSRALDRYLGSDHSAQAPSLLEARGELRHQLGDSPGARADLETAVSLLAERFGSDPQSGLPGFDPGDEAAYARIGKELALLELDSFRADPLTPLLTLERTRAPWLPQPLALPTSDATLVAKVPEGRLVIIATTDGSRIVSWLLSRRAGLGVVEAPLPPFAAIQTALEANDDHDAGFRRATAPFYDALVRSALIQDPTATELVIVPDAALAELPYLGLFDSESRQYLTDQLPVSLATSLWAALTPDAMQPGNPKVLLLAGDGFDIRLFDDLEPLPGLEPEIDRVGSIYPRSLVLSGEHATRDRTLAALQSRRPDILHFAGHLLRGASSGRLPTLLLSPSRVGSLKPEDHLLDLSEPEIDDAELLFLSACRGGDFDSLSRVVTLHSIRTGVGNLWDVEDQVAAPIAAAFHRHYLETRDSPRSLRQAIREFRVGGNARARDWSAWVSLRHADSSHT